MALVAASAAALVKGVSGDALGAAEILGAVDGEDEPTWPTGCGEEPEHEAENVASATNDILLMRIHAPGSP